MDFCSNFKGKNNSSSITSSPSKSRHAFNSDQISESNNFNASPLSTPLKAQFDPSKVNNAARFSRAFNDFK